MSLFSLKEWWRVRQGDGLEEFDQTSICIGNVDNSPRARAKIVTGSFSGMLRIYEPSRPEFLPSDLLLETQMPEPILAVAIAHFLPGVPSTLAVLHPRCLEIYQVTRPRTAADDEVPFLELQRQLVHPIPHTAANFCYGRFRGATSADQILIQAYDGQVYIFEDGSLIQTTFFEDFLVPGPVVFARETDSIITCSSAFELQSYSYLSLVQASITKSEAAASHAGHALSKRKSPVPQWKLLFGELASDIQLTASDAEDGMSDIVVVGERTVSLCSQHGELKFQRRLDYHPAAVTSYRLPSGDTNLIISTHTSNVVIYHRGKVVWLAKGPTVPVAIAVAPIGQLDAAIVILDDEGLLSVCYPGTTPPTTVLGFSETREPDWEAVQDRRKELMRIIRDKAPAADIPAAPTSVHDITLRTSVPAVLIGEEEFGAFSTGPQSCPTCDVKLYVGNNGSCSVSDIEICVQSTWPVIVEEGSHLISSLRAGGSTPCVLNLAFSCDSIHVPCNTEVTVLASFLDSSGTRCTCSHAFKLPFSLFAQLVPPLKSSTEKLTVILNQAPAAVLDLFDDIAQSSSPEATSHSNSSAIVSMQLGGNEECTILVSKNNNKYRLQGTSYEALWLPLQELVERVKSFYASESGVELSFDLEEGIPLPHCLACIDAHFQLRQKRRRISDQLEQAAAQFRVTQKCLLAKYRETRPHAIQSLCTVLENTLDTLLQLADEDIAVESALKKSACALSCAVQLLHCCLRCRYPSMTDETMDIIKSHISVDVSSEHEIGWQECTDAALVDLLRGPLAQTAKERGMIPTINGPLTQCDTLKGNLMTVVSRLGAGALAEVGGLGE